MVGAAFLNVDTYEEVEHDEDATAQAAMVVVMVAVASAIGGLGLGAPGAVKGAAASIGGWLVWAGITWLVGTKLFGGTATWGELLRTLGFANTPGLLMVFGIIPLLGWPVVAASALWRLVTGFVAVRQALDFGNGKTFATVVVGWVCYAVVSAVL
jgi:hypothetical protein